MTREELIERLRKHACYTAFPKPVSEAADALELADKRIAELERKIDEAYKKGYATGEEEAERKLAVAREACKDIRRAIERECYAAAYIIVSEALAQIGGEDAR